LPKFSLNGWTLSYQVYETALITFDLITAVLLFGQFAFLRSRAILVLASGYRLHRQ